MFKNKLFKINGYIILIILFLFIIFSFLFIKQARINNTWPFNTKMGYIVPESLKRVIYSITTRKNEKIITYYYDLDKSLYQIPDHEFLKYGGAVEQLNKYNLLLISSYGKINIFNLKEKKFFKNFKNLDNFESIRDFNINYKKQELNVLAVTKVDDDCANISLYNYKYLIKDNNIDIFNKKLIWESEKNCKFANKTSGARVIEKDGEYFISTGIFQSPKNSGIIKENWPQKYQSSFGKVIKINKNNISSIYALGLRNSQGLFLSNDNNILFGTDHGPRGGDELNIITKNSNYGWPCISYGKLYSKLINEELNLYPKLSEIEGCNKNTTYKAPLYAFADSVGISQGIFYNSDYFNNFKGNLIVSSLKGKSLFRFVLNKDKNRILTMEKIKIGSRIRDISTTFDGKIILTTDKGFLIIIEKNI